MGRRGDRRTGFSTVEVLIVVAIVALIGLAGALVYLHHNATHGTNTAATDQKQSSNSPRSGTNTQPQQTATQYLTITEWGVKLPLSNTINDAYYTVKGSNVGSDGLPNTAWLGMTSLNSSGCNISTAGPSAQATPLGSIVRVLPTDIEPRQGKPYSQIYPGVTVGGYFYGYIASATNTKCASPTALQNIDAAFTAAVKGVVSATAAN